MKKNNEINKYYKSIVSIFPIKGKKEKEYLTGLKKNLKEFEDEYPLASHKDIINEFGEPKVIVISYLNTCDEDYLIKKIKTRSVLVRLSLIITTLFLCLCIWYCYLFYIGYQGAKDEYVNKTETTITEEEVIE